MSERADQEQDICLGCGAVLQSDDPKRAGYVAASAAAKNERIVCQRCFKMKHYNELAEVALDPAEFHRMLHQIGTEPGLIVHIVDIFDFEGSLISGLNRYGHQNPVLVAVNKIDLLPAEVSMGKLEQWVRRQLKRFGLRAADVVLISAVRGTGFEDLIAAMSRLHKGKNIYIAGATNVGKSSVINRLIRDYSSLDHELTTSRYPGTTLDLIHIPLEEGQWLVDTPGLVLEDRYTERMPADLLKAVLPEKRLKPRIYQLNDQQTLFFGALARFDFVRGNRQSFVCYMAGGVPIHRTKLETADELYLKHKGGMLSPPSEAQLEQLPPFTVHTFRMKKNEPSDVLISGLGWIKATGKEDAVIDIHVPRGIKVVLREAML